MIIRKKLARLVKARLANMEADHHERRDFAQALFWLQGDEVTVDFKIESRFSRKRGTWVWRLLYGVCGLSAASTLVEWAEPTEAERKASNAAARRWAGLPPTKSGD